MKNRVRVFGRRQVASAVVWLLKDKPTMPTLDRQLMDKIETTRAGRLSLKIYVARDRPTVYSTWIHWYHHKNQIYVAKSNGLHIPPKSLKVTRFAAVFRTDRQSRSLAMAACVPKRCRRFDILKRVHEARVLTKTILPIPSTATPIGLWLDRDPRARIGVLTFERPSTHELFTHLATPLGWLDIPGRWCRNVDDVFAYLGLARVRDWERLEPVLTMKLLGGELVFVQ